MADITPEQELYLGSMQSALSYFKTMPKSYFHTHIERQNVSVGTVIDWWEDLARKHICQEVLKSTENCLEVHNFGTTFVLQTFDEQEAGVGLFSWSAGLFSKQFSFQEIEKAYKSGKLVEFVESTINVARLAKAYAELDWCWARSVRVGKPQEVPTEKELFQELMDRAIQLATDKGDDINGDVYSSSGGLTIEKRLGICRMSHTFFDLHILANGEMV